MGVLDFIIGLGLLWSFIVLIGVGVVGFIDWVGYRIDLFHEHREMRREQRH